MDILIESIVAMSSATQRLNATIILIVAMLDTFPPHQEVIAVAVGSLVAKSRTLHETEITAFAGYDATLELVISLQLLQQFLVRFYP